MGSSGVGDRASFGLRRFGCGVALCEKSARCAPRAEIGPAAAAIDRQRASTRARCQLNRLFRRLAVAMLLGVVVYAGFALYRGLSEIGASLLRFFWPAFAIGCALALGNYLVRYLKWEYYLAALGIHGVPKVDSLLTFLSGFVLTVTPGKVGEVAKSLVLRQTHGIAIARTATIVLAERLTDVLGVVILIIAGSAGFPGGLVWAGIGALLVAMVLAVIASNTVFSRILSLLERGPDAVARSVPKVREAWESLRVITTPRALVLPTVLSAVAWALEGLALWVILRGFAQSTPIPVACFFYAVATLAGALIPVPGGLGVTEGMLEEQLARFGNVDAVTATCAMILTRFATLWFAVLVGFVALSWLRIRHPGLMRDDGPKATADPEAPT
jgi:glycosyltransferase 2 family protein